MKNIEQVSKEIGYPLPEIARKLLKDGIDSDYPNMDPATDADLQFGIHGLDALGLYTVHDLDIKSDVFLHQSNLLKPDFDLVGWYQTYLNKNNIFSSHYLSHNWGCENEVPPAQSDDCSYCHLPWDLERGLIGDVYHTRIREVLEACVPYLGDDFLGAEFEFGDEGHFEVYGDDDYFTIFD